ncbi:hypothetical protein ACPF4N_003691 [Vibrio cholerae]|nr:hypothetical protein [Vibrio cholerae]EKF9452577.1 hypothetical protein [Vibrio cholerae]
MKGLTDRKIVSIPKKTALQGGFFTSGQKVTSKSKRSQYQILLHQQLILAMFHSYQLLSIQNQMMNFNDFNIDKIHFSTR